MVFMIYQSFHTFIIIFFHLFIFLSIYVFICLITCYLDEAVADESDKVGHHSEDDHVYVAENLNNIRAFGHWFTCFWSWVYVLLAMSSRVFVHEFTCFWEMSSRVFRFTNLCIHVFVMGSRVFRHVFTNFWSWVDVFLVMIFFCH